MSQETVFPKLPAASGEVIQEESFEEIERRLKIWFQMFLERPSPSDLFFVRRYAAEYQDRWVELHPDESEGWVLR
jgi:hypothetical protein